MLFENSKGTAVLQTLGWMILPASLIITITAILQGLGQTFFPAVVVVGGFAVKYGLNVVLVPVYGTMGAALASNIALWLILFILYIRLRTLHKQPLLSRRFTVLALVAALLMYAFLEIFLFVTGLFIPGTEERIPLLCRRCQLLPLAVLHIYDYDQGKRIYCGRIDYASGRKQTDIFIPEQEQEMMGF